MKETNLSEAEVDRILSIRPRVEKLVNKDVKLRTFITGDDSRSEMVGHVYDMTYEVIRKGVDTLVVLDDSIVRGTTLERSILHMLARLEPKRIIIVSSAPQIRYPDCYGIDMSKMGEFVAFRALIALLKEIIVSTSWKKPTNVAFLQRQTTLSLKRTMCKLYTTCTPMKKSALWSLKS